MFQFRKKTQTLSAELDNKTVSIIKDFCCKYQWSLEKFLHNAFDLLIHVGERHLDGYSIYLINHKTGHKIQISDEMWE